MKKNYISLLLIFCISNFSFAQKFINKKKFDAETNQYLMAIKKVSKTSATQNVKLYPIIEEFINSKFELENSLTVESGEKAILNQKIYNLYQLKLKRTLTEDQLILWNEFEVTFEKEWLKAKKKLQNNFLIANNEGEAIADQKLEAGIQSLRASDDSQKDGGLKDVNYQRKKELQILIDKEREALRTGKGDNANLTELKKQMASLDQQHNLRKSEKAKAALNSEKELNSNWGEAEKTRMDNLNNKWKTIFKEQYQKTWDLTLSKF